MRLDAIKARLGSIGSEKITEICKGSEAAFKLLTEDLPELIREHEHAIAIQRQMKRYVIHGVIVKEDEY